MVSDLKQVMISPSDTGMRNESDKVVPRSEDLMSK